MLTIKADRIGELGPHALATSKFIPISTLPSHDHSAKRIGDKFPQGGYDDYYFFTNIPNVPTRIPLSDFSEKSDLLKDLLSPRNEGVEYRAPPVVEVSSVKSSFKLVFDTNQHGVMFYSNNMADPSKGARKKIHGDQASRAMAMHMVLAMLLSSSFTSIFPPFCSQTTTKIRFSRRTNYITITFVVM